MLPHNGFDAISTFSGCGGSSLGYKMAGFKVLWASEFIPAAQETYRANHKGTILDTRDIRKVQPCDILDAIGKRPGELDLMDGSPPCASFSTAGRREAGWGRVKNYSDTKQRTDDLFFEFTRLLAAIQPKVFVAENVAGLVKGTAKGYFLQILSALKSCGYNVKCKVLDAQWLGVPQKRQRTIFVGVRKDIPLHPVHPSPLPYRYSIGEAIYGLQQIGQFKKVNAGTETHKFWSATPPGSSLADACKRIAGRNSFLTHTKQSPDHPCNTMMQTSPPQLYHWNEPRTLSINEMMRVCSFPDDFILTGDFPQQWERLGRAVPPVMMYHIAATIRDDILERIP